MAVFSLWWEYKYLEMRLLYLDGGLGPYRQHRLMLKS